MTAAIPVNSLEELALVSSYFAEVDFAYEFRILVYQPRFAQNICRRIFELLHETLSSLSSSVLTIIVLVNYVTMIKQEAQVAEIARDADDVD